MYSVIYIEVTEETSFKYTKPILDWVKSNFTDVVPFDLDNRSDNFMTDYALDLVDKSEKSILIYELTENNKISNLSAFMLGLTKYKKKIMFLYSGKNAAIEKLFKMFLPDRIVFCSEQQEQKGRIGKFFGNDL